MRTSDMKTRAFFLTGAITLALTAALPASAMWIGAHMGADEDADHQYLTTANWDGGTISDSFDGFPLMGDMTLYLTGGNRTTGTSGLNFDYAGDYNLRITAASGENRRFLLNGDVSFQPTSSTGRVLTIGATGAVVPVRFQDGDRTWTVGEGHTLVKGAGTLNPQAASTPTLIKEGTGILEIAFATANMVNHKVNAGELRYGTSNIMGNNGRTMTINENGTVNLQAYYDEWSTTLVLNGGTLTGSGGVGSASHAYVTFETSASGITSTGGGDINISGTGHFELLGDVTYNVGSADKALVIDMGDGQFKLGSATRTFTVADGSQAVDVDVLAQVTGTGGITKAGAGHMRLGNASNSYSGATTVTAGTLEVDGSITSDTSVAQGAIIGGAGTIDGNLTLLDGAYFLFTGDTLSVTGDVSINSSFGVGSLIVDDWSLFADGVYTLIDETATDFAALNLQDWGSGNAYTLVDGRLAYFQSGSLQLVIIPEPASLALLGLAGATLMMRRRRRA